MSDGMYEAFRPRQEEIKEVKINKHVSIIVYKDRVLITNTLDKSSVPLKKKTLFKIVKEIN